MQRLRRLYQKYIVLAVVLVLVSAALPGLQPELFVNIGISEALAPTLANVLNILVRVVLSYPTRNSGSCRTNKDDLFTRIALQSGFLMLERGLKKALQDGIREIG